MHNNLLRIASVSDIESNEKIPLSERKLADNTYDVFKRGADRYGDKTALRFLLSATTEETPFDYSYKEIFNQITRVAVALQSSGINENDAISIMLPNLPQNHFALWGAQAVGIANPVNPLLEPVHIVGIMNAVKSRVLVTLSDFPDSALYGKALKIAEEVPTLEMILTVNISRFMQNAGSFKNKNKHSSVIHERIIVRDFDEYINHPRESLLHFECRKNPHDTAAYFHTGGTTGTPKIALHSHLNEIFCAWMTGQELGWNQDEVIHAGLPLFHVNAPLISGLAAFTAGAQVLMTSPQGFRNPDVLKNFWALTEKYRMTFFMGVPTVYVELNKLWHKNVDSRSLRVAACGAAPMPAALIREFQERTGIRIIEGYGLTEGGVLSSVNPPFGESKIGSIGLRIPYQDMKTVVLDQEGNYKSDCSADEIGVIAIRGPNVFKGYLRDEDNKGVWLGDGWLSTGDLGRMDEAGYFTITGRRKDLIIRGGHNIDPKMIEEVLSEHPAIALVAAVGKPDPRVGELPVAFVCFRDGHTASESELREFSKKISEHAAIPVNIYVIDQMPLTAIGKIYKPALRLKAIEYAVNEILDSFRKEDIDVRVDVVADKRHGQLVIVDVSENVSDEMIDAIHHALETLHLMFEIHRAGQYGISKSVFSTKKQNRITDDEEHLTLSAESPRSGVEMKL